MDILFVHQNMPGQFRHLAPALAADPRHRVVFLGKRDDLALPRVRGLTYPAPKPADAATHGYVRTLEGAVRHGQAVARVCHRLKEQGFVPGLVIAHPGWGEALFVRDLFPAAKLLTYAEFYYQGEGADLGFDPEFPTDLDAICRGRIRNAHLILSLEAADAAISPTHWQKSVHPPALHDKINVIFDGVDTDRLAPDPAARFELPSGRVLTPADEVLTYVARNLEPYRGFHVAMRALPAILTARPQAVAVIVGGDEVSYGKAPGDGTTWRQKLVAEAGLARFGDRIIFTGKVPYSRYIALLHVSSVHLYLTYPFVLSWSCVEAMAAGCLVVGSATAPVAEFIEDGRNGRLVPFGEPAAVADAVIDSLAADAGGGSASLRAAARASIIDGGFDLATCLQRQRLLLAGLTGETGLAGAPKKTPGARPRGQS